MRKCHHHYQWYHGKLKCVRCGHRKWLTHRVKRNIQIVSVFTVLVIIGFFAYQNMGLISNTLTPVEKTVVNTSQKIISDNTKTKPNPTPANTVAVTQPIKPACQEGFKQLPDGSCLLDKPLIVPDYPESTSSSQQTIPQVTTQPSFEVKPTDMTLIASKIHTLINEQRQSNGLTPLSWNSKLAQAGLNHSTDMAKRNYFEHNSPEGQTFSMRYSEVGFNCQIPISQYEYSTGGENIMFMQGYSGEDTIASETVTGWMNSAGHRANILTAYFQSEGIGVAESDDGRIYATEDFC